MGPEILVRILQERLAGPLNLRVAEIHLLELYSSAANICEMRLEPAERRWQKVFVALPWLTFAVMVWV